MLYGGNMKPRIEVEWFSKIMEQKLRKNDHKGGWKDEDIVWLFDRAEGELKELRQILEESNCMDCNIPDIGCEEKIIFEAADVANMVMMIADRILSKLYNQPLQPITNSVADEF